MNRNNKSYIFFVIQVAFVMQYKLSYAFLLKYYLCFISNATCIKKNKTIHIPVQVVLIKKNKKKILLGVNCYIMLPGSELPALLIVLLPVPPGGQPGGHHHPALLHHLAALSRTEPTRPRPVQGKGITFLQAQLFQHNFPTFQIRYYT